MTDHKRAMQTNGILALRHLGRTANRSTEKMFCQRFCKLLGLLNYHMKTPMYVQTTHITHVFCTWLLIA